MVTMTATELAADLDRVTTDDCPQCSSKAELTFEDYSALVDGVRIDVKELAAMKCTICEHKVLTNRSKALLMWAYGECRTHGKTHLELSPKPIRKAYSFCSGHNFMYDQRDYENIPGLGINRDGFLTPVFFKKDALIYFMHHPQYELNLGSETYGTLGRKDGVEIPFGINSNGRVVMWLGDLDQMDSGTLRYLEIHNVESDHTVTASEFYDAQLNCKWSEPITEARIVNLRHRLYELQKANRGLDLYHLDEEVVAVFDEIKKPIVFDEPEIRAVVTALHKILVEAINIPSLRAFYKAQAGKDPSDNWGSIKYVEFILSQQSQKDIRPLMSGLYILNDLRILFSHVVSATKQAEIRQNAATSFGLATFDLAKVYGILLDRLMALYEELVQTS